MDTPQCTPGEPGPLFMTPPATPTLLSIPEAVSKIASFYQTQPDPEPLPFALPRLLSLPVGNLSELFESLPEDIHWRYSYDHQTGILTLSGPDEIHNTLQSFFNQYILPGAMDLASRCSSSGQKYVISTTGSPNGTLVSHDNGSNISKNADCGMEAEIVVDGQEEAEYSCLVVEVGYSQSYQDLVKTARLWLLGSPDVEVQAVILVKLTRPKVDSDFSDVTKWEGFLELWEREDSSDDVTDYGSRVTFLPPLGPDSNAIFRIPARAVLGPSMTHTMDAEVIEVDMKK